MFLSVVSCSTVFGEETCCVIDNSCYQMLPKYCSDYLQLTFISFKKATVAHLSSKMLFLRLDDETSFIISCNFIA